MELTSVFSGKSLQRTRYVLMGLGVFSLCFFLLFAYFEQSEGAQNTILKARDIFIKVRHLSQEPPPQIKDVVIVAIDQESVEKLDLRWPWSREVFALMVEELGRRGAKVIGLNFFFAGLQEKDATATLKLSEAMSQHGNVVVGATIDKKNRVTRPTANILEASSEVGFFEKIIDDDYGIRRSFLIRPYGGISKFEKSFPLALAVAFSESDAGQQLHFDRPAKTFILKGFSDEKVLLGSDGSYTINYLAPASDFTMISAWKVAQGKFADHIVRDKVVIVGATSPILGDAHPTPLGMMPGVMIHSNEFLSILANKFLYFLPRPFVYWFSWFAAMLVLAPFLSRRFWWGISAFFVVFFVLSVVVQQAFLRDVVIEPFILLMGSFMALGVGLLESAVRLLLKNRGLETTVIRDKMTGLFTYEHLRQCLEEEWKRCLQSRQPVSIVMTDLDRFKQINDTLGHEIGNDMIRNTAKVIQASVRRFDVVARYGGDEFVVLLRHTNLEEAKRYQERLRDLYHQMAKNLKTSQLQSSSVSIGVACFDPKEGQRLSNPQQLIEEADRKLFIDKAHRRGLRES